MPRDPARRSNPHSATGLTDTVPVLPVDSSGDEARLRDRYRTMARIRVFEQAVGQRFRNGDIHGFVHTSIGQEAIAAGVCSLLRDGDYLTTTHRGHGHCLARGADPTAMMAELFGRETGSCRGRGGSMHIAQADLGILGANGIVGAGIPIAVGAALAVRASAAGGVAVSFFGEGAVHSGAFHEAMVLAVAWQAPVVFVCENNHYAEFTPTAGAWNGPTVTSRAASYNLPAITADGNDVFVVEASVGPLIEAARAGGGPQFAELVTYRIGGHYEGDATAYRDEAELALWQAADPLLRAGVELGVEADTILEEARQEIEAAVLTALDAPYPDPATVLENVYG